MSLISEALDFLYATVHDPAVAGEAVTYTTADGLTTIPSLLAVLEKATAAPPSLIGLAPGQYDLAQASPKNIDHDFSVMAADLVDSHGVRLTPQRGDLIRRTFGGSTKVYSVMADSSTGKIWAWQDGYDKRYLIHSKFIREE